LVANLQGKEGYRMAKLEKEEKEVKGAAKKAAKGKKAGGQKKGAGSGAAKAEKTAKKLLK
jgi:hypothetical protein